MTPKEILEREELNKNIRMSEYERLRNEQLQREGKPIPAQQAYRMFDPDSSRSTPIGEKAKEAAGLTLGVMLGLSFWLSVPLGIYVTATEWGYNGFVNFLNIVLCFIPLGGFINWLFHLAS